MKTTYYCAGKCLDCGWGGCVCMFAHCCCQFDPLPPPPPPPRRRECVPPPPRRRRERVPPPPERPKTPVEQHTASTGHCTFAAGAAGVRCVQCAQLVEGIEELVARKGAGEK